MFTIIGGVIIITIIIYVFYRNKKYPCISCEKIGCSNCSIHKTPVLST